MSDSKLTHTRVVMGFHFESTREGGVFDVAVYGEEHLGGDHVTIRREKWEAMGRPAQILVTVEPLLCLRLSPDLGRRRLCDRTLDHDGPHEGDGLRWSA